MVNVGTTPAEFAPEPAQTVADRFPRLDLGSLLATDRPPREWVVEGLIPAGASVSIIAAAGTGKSLLVLSLALDVARGRRAFAGLPIPVQRRVLMLDMENTEDDLAERLKALGLAGGDGIPELVYLHLPPLPMLDTAEGGRNLLDITKAYGLVKGDVIVLDSLQRVIGGKENDSDTLRAFYASTGLRLKKAGYTVIRTDNAGKEAERGARGTSGKRDDVDVELLVKASGDQLHITTGKVRLPDVRPVVLQRLVDDDGRLRFSSHTDPFQAQVAELIRFLDDSGEPWDLAQEPATSLLRKRGMGWSRAVIRAAVNARKSAPPMVGVSSGEQPTDGCAEPSWRNPAQTPLLGVEHA